ncbi:ABC transporter ATP-binding protein [Thalassobacillus sp. CUG 92003]|uniref:ABC transporter ATP-binding protein n=1 Tax=Thalassobacillus sp. CUG 92003 TaxID=2736641 RepID=UPI0015E744A4|nr:ATP-binding cassette domain-containing protein [Thalassobacillus sp. CUG 92003]
MSKAILSVSKLGKHFKSERVVQNISFDVHKGEVMAILGPNGAGKSTTIRSIMGIMYQDEGDVIFHNHDNQTIPRHKIGYLPEERGLYKNVKVMDILLYFAELKDYPSKKARQRVLHYLAKFDLEGKENTSVEALSKGMAQKVQFIGAITHEPELLILDEPFSGLDPVSQEVFKREIQELADGGTAILLSSHQMNLVEELCDRLFMMHKGKEVISGALADVKAQYANFKCTIYGENDRAVLEQLPQVQRVEQDAHSLVIHLVQDVHITRWLQNIPEELDIQELSIDRVSLHEIFVDVATGNHSDQLEGVDHA